MQRTEAVASEEVAAARAQVRAALAGPASGLALEVVAETDSTNADLLDPDCQGATPCCVRWALRQRAGRGRKGRRWLSDQGSLTFSLRRPFRRGGGALLGLPLAVAVAICQGLEDLGISELAIKWPNDLLRHGRKLGGILVEVAGGSAVVGIGLNVALAPALRTALEVQASDLHTPGRPPLARPVVLGALLNRLVPALDEFEAAGFLAFQAAWTARAAWLGQRVRLGDTQEGVLLGVDEEGALRLLGAHGEMRGLVGDLSLRPLDPEG